MGEWVHTTGNQHSTATSNSKATAYDVERDGHLIHISMLTWAA
jgi:hypothetical protein